jgi:uncharacterized HAD superfamily protein
MKTVTVEMRYIVLENGAYKSYIYLKECAAEYRIHAINALLDEIWKPFKEKYVEWFYSKFNVTGDDNINFWLDI